MSVGGHQIEVGARELIGELVEPLHREARPERRPNGAAVQIRGHGGERGGIDPHRAGEADSASRARVELRVEECGLVVGGESRRVQPHADRRRVGDGRRQQDRLAVLRGLVALQPVGALRVVKGGSKERRAERRLFAGRERLQHPVHGVDGDIEPHAGVVVYPLGGAEILGETMKNPARSHVGGAGAIPPPRQRVEVAVDDAGLKAMQQAEPAPERSVGRRALAVVVDRLVVLGARDRLPTREGHLERPPLQLDR